MKTWTKYLIISLSFVILTSVALYSVSPQLIRWVIERELGEHFELQSFEMERPSLSGLHIKELAINTIGSSTQRLEVTSLTLELDWLQPKIKLISLKKIEGTLSLEHWLQASRNEKSNSYSGGTRSVVFPELSVEQIDLDLDIGEQQSIRLRGGLNFSASQMDSALTITSSWEDKIQLSIAQEASDVAIRSNVTIHSPGNWSKLVTRFFPNMSDTLSSLSNNVSGQLSGNAVAKLTINPNQNSSTSLALTTEPVVLKLVFAEANIRIVNAAIAEKILRIENINTDLKLRFSDGVWQNKTEKLSALVELFEPPEWLNKRKFQVSGHDWMLLLNGEKVDLSGTLVVENSKITIKSYWPERNLNESTHRVSLNLSKLDKQWSDALKGKSIGKVLGDIEFNLKRNSDTWLLNNTKLSNGKLYDLSSKEPVRLTLKRLEVYPAFPKQFALNEPKVDSLKWNAFGLNIQAKKWKAWSQVDLSADMKSLPDYFDVNLALNPSKLELVSKELLLTGSELKLNVVGRFRIPYDFNSFDGSVEFDSLVYSPKPMLMTIAPEQKKLIQNLVVASTPTLSGKVSISKAQHQTLHLKGSSSITVTNSSLGELTATQFDVHVNWAKYQPWHQFEVLSQFDLNYQSIDQQQHEVKLYADILPELRFKNLKIDSKLFDGEANVFANDNYEPWSSSSGVLSVSNVNLEKVSKVMASSDLFFSGRLSGKLPFYVEQNQLHFHDGLLRSEQGVVRYLPGGIKKSLTKESVSNIASIALQNFHYNLLNAKLNKGGPCSFDFDIRLEGRNPDLGDKAQQNFNIKYQPGSNVNLYYLLLLGQDFIKQLEQNNLHSACVN